MRNALRIARNLFVISGLLLTASCVSEPPKKPLTLSEQIEVDTHNAEGLVHEFKQKVTFIQKKSAQIFMEKMVDNLLKKQSEFKEEKIEVVIHDDTDDAKLRRFFSFPGTTLSVPYSFVKKVEYENELAAALSYEIGNVINRFLAKKVERQIMLDKPLELFSEHSVFNLSKEERSLSIHFGTALLDEAGYDRRGMASIFKRYSAYYVQETKQNSSDLMETQVAWMVHEAQQAQSEFLPQIKPIVRSGEFIQFKKELLLKK